MERGASLRKRGQKLLANRVLFLIVQHLRQMGGVVHGFGLGEEEANFERLATGE